MLVSDYNYNLPEERIAKFPPEERGSTRLLTLNRETGEVQDSHYRNLDDFLRAGDLVILNDTRVMQSRLFCTLPDGRERELVVLEKHGDEPQRVMYRGKLHDGDVLTVQTYRPTESINKNLDANYQSLWMNQHNSDQLPHNQNLDHHKPIFNRGDKKHNLNPKEVGIDPTNSNQKPDEHNTKQHFVTITRILGNGTAEVESETPLAELAEQYGTVPLPPYLHRDANDEDKKRYQTIWAKYLGSAAAPTASLNMTKDLLQRLQDKGVELKYLTLHVGLGTFLPIRTDNIEDHKMHSEWFHIPDDTLKAIKAAKQEGRRIVAVGTTVTRTLEYYAKTGKTAGEDDIFIYPGYQFQIVDALLTNFHAPKSTVLMLAAAFAGWDHLKNAYDHAVKEQYNFLSYGDSMLIY